MFDVRIIDTDNQEVIKSHLVESIARLNIDMIEREEHQYKFKSLFDKKYKSENKKVQNFILECVIIIEIPAFIKKFCYQND